MRVASLLLVLAAVSTFSPVPAFATCTDADADGYFPVEGCGTAVDCNDAGASIHPGAAETCNAFDDDCDGTLDEGCDRTCDAPVEAVDDVYVSGHVFDSDLVWTGSGYGMAWSAVLSGGTPDSHFVLLDESGSKLSSVANFGDSRRPDIVWTGTEFGMVRWRGAIFPEQGYNVIFTRFAANGTQIGTDLVVARGEGPNIAWNGSEYGVVYWESGKVYFVRIGADGSIPSPPTEVMAEESSPASLVWNGTEYGFHWGHDVSARITVGTFARLSAAGDLIGSPVPYTDPAFYASAGVLEWASGEWGIAWTQNLTGGNDAYFRRISSVGSLVGDPVRVTTQLSGRVTSLAWTGAEYGLAFSRVAEVGAEKSYFRRLHRDGGLAGPEIRIDDVEPEFSAYSDDLAANGAGFGFLSRSAFSGTMAGYFSRLDCSCTSTDADGDTVTDCAGDCDDADGAIYPGASETCDGKSNDCGSPTWPRLESDWDRDGDLLTSCSGDCDESNAAIYDGAPQLCDGFNNDCGDPSYPVPPANEADADEDGVRLCGNDCDDANPTVYPGAIQACDGINNDCDDPLYPTPPANEADGDTDGVRICSGDCDDGNPAAYPGATEVCDAADNDCDALIDEDAIGEDTDGDGVRNLCDNCPTDFNSSQLDADTDGVGNVCDNCITTSNPDQADADTDTVGDLCDNCPVDTNANQADADADGSGDVCDCAIADPETHPGAPEVNDGLDNQCFGDDGFGLVDETSGDSGFHDAIDKTRYSWPPQQGATEYEAVRSESADMGGPCASTLTTGSFWIDAENPQPGAAFHYLNRPTAPHLGSWGADSAGTERVTVCP